MPSQRDPQEPQDPIEDDDLIGAGEEDAEEADDAADEETDDILDEEAEDELDDEDEDAALEDEPEDEAVSGRESLTGEVGSEGGSPGETVLRRDGRNLGFGSEATSTWEGGADGTIDLKDDDGVPIKGAR